MPSANARGRHLPARADISTRSKESTVPASVFDSDGSALVIHVGVDDYVTDPTGNAGDRAACGLVVAD
jgi:Cu/Zn superoxide dismutase